MSKTTSQPFEFSRLSKWLHWGILFLLVAQIFAGLNMARLEDTDPQKMMIYRFHGVMGILIILTTLARIIIRLRRSQPIPEGMTERWNIWLHNGIQWAIYIVLLLLGVSGMGTLSLNSMNIFTADPAVLDRTVPTIETHAMLVLILLVLIFLHVVGVFHHQFTRGNILRRMGINRSRGNA